MDELAKSNGAEGYYQIPTLSFQNLEYGTYSIELIVMSQAENGQKYTYYLDGIRIYNPMNYDGRDAVVSESYGNEINAVFTEVRDLLLDANSFSADGETGGPVFLDMVKNEDGTEITAKPTYTLAEYKDYGPKNEVYLAAGQAIVFKVDAAKDRHFYLGLKAPSGATEATITYGDGRKAISIESASDMYYEVTPKSSGLVMVKNTGTQLLSITKLRTTGAAAEPKTIFRSTSLDEFLTYANRFDMLHSAQLELPVLTEPPTLIIDRPEAQDPNHINYDFLSRLLHILDKFGILP